ncbi:MAG: phage integrase SAM-like domain-containing protein [Flavobacteriales bacterium]|nr:phage integrase SAM-like domain-containing protein [Flavobacteriales bacterium]
MKVYFTPRKNKNHNIIYIEISLGRGRQYRFSTGIKFNDIKAFNNNKLRNVLTEERPKEKNKTLSDLKKYVDDQLYLYESEGTYVTKELCKNIVTAFGKASVNAKSEIQKFDLIEHLDKFIEQIKSGYILTDDEGEYSDNGIKKFITLRNHLIEFESQHGKLKPPQIDKKFFRSFQIFLSDYTTIEGVKKNLINNSINKNVAILKTFINRYLLAELEVKLRNYESKVVKRLKDDNKGQVLTYLDISEILRLYNLDLSERDSVYEVVRDQWVFIALTCGIRVEDYLELDKNQNLVYIQEDEKKILALSFYQNKTNVKVVAPIGIIGKKILEKYAGTFPKVDIVTSRKLIKKICKWADISSRVYAKKVKGESVRSYKKYELVGNHTARRSFCTNSYKAGVSEYKIMQISGHQDRESFFGYIGTTKEENAKMFSETKYFELINTIDETPVRNLRTI